MENRRSIGAALILLGVLVLLGNTTEALPPEAFWAGLLTYPIGGYLFFKGSREAIRNAEERTLRNLNPKIRNKTAEAHARGQDRNIREHGPANDTLREARVSSQQALNEQRARQDEELVLYEVDDPEAMWNEADDFKISSDVSFPIEIQEQDTLATQIAKLRQLQEDGIISAEEFSIAKAKLLG